MQAKCLIPIFSDREKDVLLTPRNIRVSSEHVLVFFDDCNRVTFPIAFVVKGTGSPAMSGGLPTQRPVAVIPNCRRKKPCYHTRDNI